MTDRPQKFVPAAQRVSHEIRKEIVDLQADIADLTAQLRVKAIQRIQLEIALAAINEPNTIITGVTPTIEHEPELPIGDGTERIASIVGRKGT